MHLKRVIRLALLTAALFYSGCAPQAGNEQMATGKVIPAKDLPGWKGDTQYGEINSAWLKDFYAEWKADLFAKGVVKWDGRFDCNRFAASFQSAAQIQYFIVNFHSYTKGNAAAIAEVWYCVGGDRSKAHAIVLAYTERGPVYMEPQNGAELALTDAEKNSIYYTRF